MHITGFEKRNARGPIGPSPPPSISVMRTRPIIHGGQVCTRTENAMLTPEHGDFLRLICLEVTKGLPQQACHWAIYGVSPVWPRHDDGGDRSVALHADVDALSPLIVFSL